MINLSSSSISSSITYPTAEWNFTYTPIANIEPFKLRDVLEVCDKLPENPIDKTLYFIKNMRALFFYVEGEWIKLATECKCTKERSLIIE